MEQSLVPIGAVARLTGIAASALRYYEELGLIRSTRDGSGRRLFDDAALRRLKMIPVLQRAGFSLDEIDQLLNGDRDWRPLASRKATELDRRLGELQAARTLLDAALGCDCEHLESCGRLAHLEAASDIGVGL